MEDDISVFGILLDFTFRLDGLIMAYYRVEFCTPSFNLLNALEQIGYR